MTSLTNNVLFLRRVSTSLFFGKVKLFTPDFPLLPNFNPYLQERHDESTIRFHKQFKCFVWDKTAQ